MKILLQRVKNCSVDVNGKRVSEIGRGMLALVGIEAHDTEEEALWLAKKTVNLRIFEDEAGKMNLSVKDICGEILAVLYEYYVQKLEEQGITVKTGIFQADMQVALINDGPVTFMLERKK